MSDDDGGPLRKRLTQRYTRLGASAYQGALEAVLAIAIAAGIGYWVDGRFGTSPRWLIVGTIVGFAAFVLRLFQMRKLFETPPQEGPQDGPGGEGS